MHFLALNLRTTNLSKECLPKSVQIYKKHSRDAIYWFLRGVCEDVLLVNPFQFSRIRGEKSSIIDVHAKDLKGRSFIIEMQVAEKDGVVHKSSLCKLFKSLKLEN